MKKKKYRTVMFVYAIELGDVKQITVEKAIDETIKRVVSDKNLAFTSLKIPKGLQKYIENKIGFPLSILF